MSVDLTRYLLFGYVNILRDVVCDCQKKKGAVDDRVFIITSSVVFRNYIPGELYAFPFSITADCQGIQVNRFFFRSIVYDK